MARGDRRDLFLSIGGSVTGLQAASKAGRTALLELGSAADDIQAEVTKALDQIGANAPNVAQQFNKAFAAIRRNAESVLSAPSNGKALQIIDAAAAEQAAEQAEKLAVQLRLEATAAATVAQRAGEAGDAHRVLAYAMEANAQQAENEAVALRNQANVLGAVRAELGEMGQAQRVATSASASQRQGMLVLGEQMRQFGTEVQLGISPVQAFTQQAGQAAFALTMFDGKLGAVGEFMGGPWGIGITLALTALVPLVAKLFDGNQALDAQIEKLKSNSEQQDLAAAASAAFAGTQQGLEQRIRDTTKALDQQNDSLRTNAELKNIQAKQELESAQQQLAQSQAALKAAREQQRAARNSLGAADPRTATFTGSDPATLAKSVEDAKAAVLKAEADVKSSFIDVNNSRIYLAAEQAAAEATLTGKITKEYDDRIRAVEREAVAQAKAGKEIGAATKDRIAQLEKEKQAALAAQAAEKQTAHLNAQTGRDISLTDAEAIVAGIGGRVTSARRSTAKQAELYARYEAGEGPLAAKPGTSYHERGQALDIAKTGGITLGAIAKAFADQGVRLVEKLDEGDHYHVAWKNGGPSADQVAKRNEAAAEKQARDAEAYGQLLNRAQQEHIDLTRRQVTDVAQAADLDAQGVELERQRLDAAAQAGVAQHRWTQAQADAVKAVNKQNAELKVSAIRQQEGVELLDQQIEDDRQHLTYSTSLLQLQGDLATTNDARRKIALQLLANEEQMQRDQAKRLLGSNDPRDWQKGEDLLRQIDAEHPYKTEEVNRRFAAPVERYRDQLQESVGNWNTALQGVKVDGLQSIEDGLLGIINGTESVSSAFKKMASSIISDIARIIIERTILSAIDGGSLFGLHLATGGKIEGKATGGIIRGPGTGTSDSILALIDGSKPLMVSNGESIVTAEATQRYWPLIDAMNKGKLPHFATGGMIGVPRSLAYPRLPSSAALAPTSLGNQRLQLDARVQVEASPLLDARMRDVSIQTVGAAAEPIMAGAQSRTIKRLSRPALPGGWG